MNSKQYPSPVRPRRKRLHRWYIGLLMFFMGRALQAASRVDKHIAAECASLPPGLIIVLTVLPFGPQLALQVTQKGNFRYLFGNVKTSEAGLVIMIKHIEAAMLMFTFRESTALSFSRDRMVVKGNLEQAMTFVRCLNAVEVYLLPKFVARLAVKQYPDWPLLPKIWRRTRIYWRTMLGY